MNIALFGNHGSVERYILESLLTAGYRVSLLAGEEDNIPFEFHNLKIVRGEWHDKEDITETLTGAEAVVQVLGFGKNESSVSVGEVCTANRLIVEQMKETGIRRIVALSAIGAGSSIYYLPHLLQQTGLASLIPWYNLTVGEKNEVEHCIQSAGGLDWTFVRAGIVRKCPPKGDFMVSYDGKGMSHQVTAEELGEFFAKAVADEGYVGRAPMVCNPSFLF